MASPEPPDLKTALRQVPFLQELPESELQWLIEQGSEIHYPAGAQIAKQGDPADGFYIILSGETEWTQRVQDREAHAVTLGTGEVFAELILLLEEPYPTTGRALSNVWLYKLEADAFWELLFKCRFILREILKISTQRSQIHASVSQQQAKLISLGTLSAGLAHELNNPAAAVKRSSQELCENYASLSRYAFRLNQWELSSEQREFVDRLPVQVLEQAREKEELGALERSDREDEIADWLEDADIAESWKLAPSLVDVGIDSDWLNRVAQQVPKAALSDVLSWLNAEISGKGLLQEIDQGAGRISELVKAIKEYTHMDEAPIQEIDLHTGIESTLVILKHKLKQGHVSVCRQFAEDMPKICAYGSELNQVWTNLLDNAIDAMDGSGKIEIRTAVERDRVRVEIVDSGSGIPTEVKDRMFDPFFTTKETGKGTGLGLDIVQRIVQHHHGDIRVQSQPGETCFQVRLPRHPPKKDSHQSD
ncbi:cyclic nucleotide-binding domain-containing protein [Romeria aff. gracilis LEGE 07310]|uniref:histidine kinase n=1 Tax=Vasconcelosia minhoensis LEGE 07310 TaxID=915328 RepID=A0A8J7AHZ0_9CYAN|nr:ATP-binding protein [Romeria gracilis]MBE9079289.1 cyclic nucleotide-binding domain-containing protein [Romeria aff. gracilis LEGE 07310]